MGDKGESSDLRSRYRHQPTRSKYHGMPVSRQVLATRPHAMPYKAMEGVVTIPVKRALKSSAFAKTPKSSLKAVVQKPAQHKKAQQQSPKKTVYHKERPVQRSYVLRREAVEKPVKNKKTRFIERAKQPQAMLAAAGVVVFVFGVTVSLMGLKTNKEVAAQPSTTHAAQATDENPDEKDVGDKAVSSYKVAPDLPRRITIPKINVNARVKHLDIKEDNQLMAPTNIFDAGWYQRSARPGDNGAMLIDGHVSGRTRPGVFKNLHTLVAGDKISVERGDGQVFTYRVVKSQAYPKDQTNMASALVPVESGKQGLNIITCAGTRTDGTNGYNERLIVYAVRE